MRCPSRVHFNISQTIAALNLSHLCSLPPTFVASALRRSFERVHTWSLFRLDTRTSHGVQIGPPLHDPMTDRECDRLEPGVNLKLCQNALNVRPHRVGAYLHLGSDIPAAH